MIRMCLVHLTGRKKRIRPGQPDLFFPQGNSVFYVIISYDFMNHSQNMKLGVTL